MIAALLCWSAAPPLAAQPQVTLFVPENQRLSKELDWFGAFVEFTLRAQFEAAGLTPASFEAAALARPADTLTPFSVTGAYQKVGRLHYLKLVLWRAGVERVKREETFTKTEVADRLTSMARKLVQAAGGTPAEQVPYLAPEVGRALYQARWERYRGQGPTIDQARQLDQAFGSAQAQIGVIAEVAAQLMLAAHGDLERGAPLLKRADRLLRRALKHHPNSGELLALLALDYHLSQSYPSFVEQTAAQALEQAPQSDLATLMLAVSAGLSSGRGKEALARFGQLNPWALKGTGKRAYWLGILEDELNRARKAP